MEILNNFTIDGQNLSAEYVETQQVNEGVECDIYSFPDDRTKDLAIVRVSAGYKTPLQRVQKGVKTSEGFLSGRGVLIVTSKDGVENEYYYPNSDGVNEVVVAQGETMQWSASDNLTFYEVCDPPYEDGRFENII